MRRAHVVGDLAQDALLRRGEVEGKDPLHDLADAVVDLERDALAQAAHLPAAQREAELKEEQLLEDQPQVARAARRVQQADVVVAGHVDVAEGLAARDQPQPLAHGRRQRVGQARVERGGQPGEDAPQRLAAQRAELLVYRHHPAGVHAGRVVVFDQLVLRRAHHQAAAVAVALDGAVEGDAPPARERVLEEGLVEPERLHAAALVLQPGFEERHPPRAAQAGHRDPSRDRGPLAGPQVGDPRALGAVFVPQRQVIQEVLDRRDPDLGEVGGPLGTDTPHVLHRIRELHPRAAAAAHPSYTIAARRERPAKNPDTPARAPSGPA